MPNELWQTDATAWHLLDSSKVEILNLIDDHSRFCLASVAIHTVRAADAVQAFYSATQQYGLPARFLSDNAAVFSGKSRRGRVALESELDRLGVETVATPAAKSPFVTSADCATSMSVTSTGAKTSFSSWPATMCASSPKTAPCYAN